MSSTRSNPAFSPDSEAVPATSDPRHELLGRVLASSVFSKSERLSSLLTHICDLAFTGREKDLNEQEIGEAVFDRPVDFDASIDGIVRTQASRLRKKLDLYFNGEGADEPIRIVIPRGGYVPLFEPRTGEQIPIASPEPALTVAPEKLSSVPPDASKRRSFSTSLAWSLVAILAVWILALFLYDRDRFRNRGSDPTPAHTLSIPIFSIRQPTLIVPSDCGLVIAEGSMNRSVDLAEYLRGDYLDVRSEVASSAEKMASAVGRRRYTSIVDLEVVQALSEIARAEKSKFEIRYARDVRPNDLKQGNVILLGAAEGNPWVELFEHSMNFVISKNWKDGAFFVFNRSPQGSESRQWESAYDDSQHRVYGIVAYLPNLGGDGNALVLEGTSMAGTECAWDFVSDDSQVRPFLKRIRRPDGTLPHFEVLLQTNNMSGSAVKGNILAWRVMP